MANREIKNLRDPEDADPDYQPPSIDNAGERPSTQSRRVTRSTATNPSTHPQNRDNEAVQEEASDGADDATFSDSTSEASAQGAAVHPQESTGRRVRKCGPTVHCGVFSPRKGEPKAAKRGTGDFYCIICDSRFTRIEGVNYHFPICAQEYGNPHSNRWNDHESCASKKAPKNAPAADPSTHAQPSVAKKQVVQKESSGSSSANPSGGDETVRSQLTPQLSALPTRPRETRLSQQHDGTAHTQPASQLGDLPTRRRAARSRATNDEVADTPPVLYPGDFPTGPRAPRPRATNDGTVQTQPASRPAAPPPTGLRVTRSQATQRTAEIRPDSEVVTDAQPPSKHSTPTPTPSKHSAPERSAAQPKPTQAKRRTQNRTKAARGFSTHLDESLPPLANLHDIFKDMVSNAKEKIHLAQAMKVLSHKQIRVATMCSGTESPLLALDMIQNGLRVLGLSTLNLDHQFSAEIEPYKQAYIERNFHPRLLFRDIREIAQGGQATTAYGALADVPPFVDLLVAGFSCVDFSKLNKNGKKLTDLGESGDTFRAILMYAKKYRPAMIILENVEGAPWKYIEAIWKNDRKVAKVEFDVLRRGTDDTGSGLEDIWDEHDLAYAAAWVKVDAKQYYIPHTRTRGYMICLDRRRFLSRELGDKAVKTWQTYMKALQRKASVSVEAFLLLEDDPRLQCAKDEMTRVGRTKQDRDWEVCNGRYDTYRTNEKLGILRPILDWANDGSIKASSYLWTDWSFSQVERIWDTVEISFLRNAAKGYDSFFKARFWELSQNIDRFQDTTPAGVINCIVPHGMPLSTIRGGPITGLEAIALQGLPIDRLLLTRETGKELFELAGNAMTSTVVGAALLSALSVGHEILTNAKESVSQPVRDSDSDLKPMRYTELGNEQVLHFDGSDKTSLEELCQMAKMSIRLCHCEGQSSAAPTLIRKCKSCHHTCCEKCGNKPKHEYGLLGGTGAPLRIEPQEFRKRVRYAIPTRLGIDGFSPEGLEHFAQHLPDRSEQEWKLFSEAILLAFKQEFRYESIKRSDCWIITYIATHSRLELVFDREDVYWLLYGKPDQSEPGNSPVRKLLSLPLARLTVRGKTMRGELMVAESMLQGSWEIRLPLTHKFSITVTPQGQLVDSWEKKLGLQGKDFIDKQVYTSLHVAYTSELGAGQVLDHDIRGDYDLLEDCGTASSSLHKKRPTANARDAPALYLFLDADRLGPPEQDSYVFATKKQRLEYGESRSLTAQVDSKWRPPHVGTSAPDKASSVQCTVLSRWEPCLISLRPYQGLEKSLVRFPAANMSMSVFGEGADAKEYAAGDHYGCFHELATTALLSCSIPEQSIDSVGWQIGHWTIIDQRSERQIAAAFAWLFARVKDLGGFKGDWRSLDPCPSGYQECLVCAPKPPRIMWTCSRGNTKKPKIIPYEDGREAGDFERKIKSRPAPFLVQTSIDDDEHRTGRLLVGLHLPTLVHRALGKIGNIADSDELEIKWRLDTRFEAPTGYKLRDFTLTNNKLSLEADYAFPTGEKLRPEQKRSLQWMIGQEADDMGFYEEEIEESILSQLSWRAEVRVRRNRIVRGGILADEVGYGKTATTLALIHTQEKRAEEYAEKKTLGCISVKATLILVPTTLVHQWKGQANKFLGLTSDDDRILVVNNVTELANISVQRIRQAVIIIASWNVISSPVYLARMSHFAALPQGPSSGEREIDAWLTRACGNIEKHTGELVNQYKSPKEFAAALKLRLKAAHIDKEILRDVPTQRLKGAKYETWNPAERVTPVVLPPTEKYLRDAVKHMECKDFDSMTGLLLHMFDFHRIVVDEYTYVDEKQKVDKLSSFITKIKARSRWVLSGTPNLQDFGDVRNLASLLAYNLGVVDDAVGVLKGAAIRRIREDRTAAEQFRAFGYSHTAAWHISRQAHAQRFLDTYASKNVAEIGVIKSLVHLRHHFLGPYETILNAELQQQLQATELRIVLHGKNKMDNDRLRRIRDLLKGCKTAPECLLRSCSHFDLEKPRPAEAEVSEDAMDYEYDDEKELSEGSMDVDDDDENELSEGSTDVDDDDENEPSEGSTDVDDDDENELSGYAMNDEDDDDIQGLNEEENIEVPSPAPIVSRVCEELITIRESQMNAVIVELNDKLLLAAWLEQQCARAPNPEHQGTHYRQWKLGIERAGLRDPTATSDLRHYLSAACAKLDHDTEELYYRDQPTVAELKKEKEAANKRNHRDKAKRTASRKAKKASEGMNDGEAVHPDDVDPDIPDPKPIKINKDDFENYASVLRKLTGHLRSLASELTSKTRSLRFAHGAQDLYQWYTSLGEPPVCRGCHQVIHDYDNISINIRCGHLTCKDCIQATKLICAVDGCGEGSESYRLRKAVDLVGDGKTWSYGSKLGNIIALINSLPADDQVLLFVQFEDVMLKMAAVLKAANISNYALSNKAGVPGRQMSDMMNDFQEDNGPTKKRVLLLNPSNETAAGINLTNANHVIFASPLLSNTQQSYSASMTQCIGRAKRYGQRKTVHIYRFAALKTIEVDILQEREQKTLAKKKLHRKRKAAEMSEDGGAESSGDWVLVREDEIDDTLEAGWGSGYDFKSNPNEDN